MYIQRWWWVFPLEYCVCVWVKTCLLVCVYIALEFNLGLVSLAAHFYLIRAFISKTEQQQQQQQHTNIHCVFLPSAPFTVGIFCNVFQPNLPVFQLLTFIVALAMMVMMVVYSCLLCWWWKQKRATSCVGKGNSNIRTVEMDYEETFFQLD